MNKLLKLQLGLLFLIFSFGAIYAQSDFKSALQDPNSLLPIDPSIRHGQLDNGMKYFIRSNKKPENRIELRLAVNAGSILEDDDQKGLAHFLEHMCFNGTENFEKNELVSYLQSVGVKFGPDLNAYTSFDETVYMIQVPADDEEILKNGLLILEDWAHRVTLDPEEINKERGVVLEEMRMGRGAGQRMLDQYLPVIFKDSKYADRLPIGTKEIIENFGYEEIKRFYDDWYRPDLMAFIAIGDFDAESMEAKVKEIFSRIPMPENPKERKIYEVPDHDETLISIVTDKEATFTNVRLYYKTDPVVYKTVGDFRKSLLHSMYTGMLNQRLEELTKKANPPYLYAGSYFGGTWAKSKDAFQVMSAMQEDGILTALEAITLENERIRRFGFTETELERYKKDIISSYEMAYNERDKTESASYASEYIRHYLSDEPIPGIEFEFAHAKHVVETVRIEEVNALTEGFLGEGNRVVVITSPEKEGLELPTKEEVLDILQKLESTELEAYDDGVADASLMEILPKAGTIKKQKKIAELDVVVLELSNGMKVTLKPTDFKNDQILFSAYAKGGHSVYGDKDYRSASNADRIVPEAGIADFTPTNLQKLLAGQNATVRPYISELYQGFSGSCVPKDLEVLFQLIHLNFTAPREDEELFEAYINRNKAIYRNLMSNPQYYFSDKLSRFLSQ
ncbi:MAG: insulinase family protein, partial [Cyclobacteriaceae bacterium]